MKKWTLLFSALLLAGCAAKPTQQDNYHEASFELCNTKVELYSVSDDGRVRIICADGSKFGLQGEDTIRVMQNINFDYCDGAGLGHFNESSNRYRFKCKDGALMSVNK